MPLTRPMLCRKLDDPAELDYPVLATPKVDGIRCLKVDGVPLSRSFKPIRNRYIADLVRSLPDGVDGELVAVGGDFSDAQSAVMSADGRPEFRYCVFDVYDGSLPYSERVRRIPDAPFVDRLLPVQLDSLPQFLRYEEQQLAYGWEGVVVRTAESPYVCGRSDYALKFKRVQDSEAVLLSLVEARTNCNPVVPNRWGYAKRPGGSGGKVPKGTLGAMVCRDVRTGVVFEIGTGRGLTARLRQHIWDDPASYVGRVLRYTYQAVGTAERPRFPSFSGWRDPEDMS